MKHREPNTVLSKLHPHPPRLARAELRDGRPAAAGERPRDRAEAAADAGAVEYASWLRLLHQLRA